MVEVVAKDQFIDALPEEFRLRLRQNKPETLQQALEQALELESIYQANKQRSKVVREVQLESTSVAQVNKTAGRRSFGDPAVPTGCRQQCTNKSKGKQKSGNQRGRGPQATGQNHPVCWRCKKEGHIQHFCTEVLPSESDEQTSQPSERSRGGASPQTQSGNSQ